MTENPFSKNPKKPQVYLSSGLGAYKNTLAALRKIDLSQAKGKRVLLKPNVGRVSRPRQGVNTDPMVVAAAIDVFRKAGAEVVVGESPISGVNTFEAFETAGIAAVAKERECPLLDMDVRPSVALPVPSGIAIKKLSVCADVFEYDFIVSMPVMKTHMHTGVTLSVKNMKGCLWRRSKVALHMLPAVAGMDEKPIDIAISDMYSVLKPHIAIIDGTVGMEGLGPSAGHPKSLDLVLVSTDPLAADAVACALMGMDAGKVPHVRLAHERGCGEINLAKISVFPDNWREFVSPFALPPVSLSIEFPGTRIHDRNSCSACQSTLFLFLKRYKNDLLKYFPNGYADIAIGKGHKSLPKGTLCIGNCARAHKNAGIFVGGCPPVASEILRAVSGKSFVDVEDGKPDA